MPGTLIVLEGPDGAGTTSHSTLLADKLRKHRRDIVLTAEPTDGPIGRFIREQLKQKSISSAAALQLLFTADRAWHVETVIAPALKRGQTVITDRYVTSTIVYGRSLGLDAEWLYNVNAAFPKPDILLLLLPPFEVCQERMKRRASHDLLENETLQRAVHRAYGEVAQSDGVSVIDTSYPIDDVAAKVVTAVQR